MQRYRSQLTHFLFFRTALLFAVTFCLCTSTAAVAIGWQQEQVKDDPAAQQMYETAATLFNAGEFDLAIDRWKSLIDQHPSYSGIRDTKYFMGMAYYRKKDFPNAVNVFESLRDSLPSLKDYPRSDKLLFHLAYTQFKTGTGAGDANILRQALKTFDQYFTTYPNSEQRDEAYHFQGTTYYELNHVDDQAKTLDLAAQSFNKVVTDFPESPVLPLSTYFLGVCQQESGQYQLASQTYDLFLNEHSEHDYSSETKLRRADCLLQLGIAAKNTGDADVAAANFKQAETYYQPLVEDLEYSNRPMAMHQMAYCLLHMNQYERAADLYATIATDYPNFEFANTAAIDAGKYYFQSRKLPSAEEWLQKVYNENEAFRWEACHWLCRTKLEMNKANEVLLLADDALQNETEPYRANLLMNRADALDQMDDRKADAVAAYLQTATEFPNHRVAPQALYYASFGYLQAGLNEKAMQTAELFQERYTADNTFYPDSVEIIGRAATNLKQFDLAEKTFTNLRLQFPNHQKVAWWGTRIGWVHYLQGEYDRAVAGLSELILKTEDQVVLSEANYVIGASQFELKNNVKAVEHLKRSLTHNPERVNRQALRILMARSHARLKEYEQAIALSREVWNDAKNPTAGYWMGEFQYLKGDFESAITSYQQVVDLQPEVENRPDALYGLAWAYTSNKEFDKAIGFFDELLAKYSQHSLADDARFGRGKALRSGGKLPEAIADFNEYLKEDLSEADRFSAIHARALCYVDLENWDNAISDLEALSKNLQQNPELADGVLFDLAWSYKETNQPEQAISTFTALTTDYPNSPKAAEAHYHIGENHYEAQDYTSAMPRFRAAIQGTSRPKVGELASYRLAWCLYKTEDFPEAQKAFQNVANQFPNGQLKPLALSMAAESHFQLDQYSDAVTVYKLAVPAITASSEETELKIVAPLHAAQSANRLKQFDVAIDYANIVVENYPDSPLVADAWYEIGEAKKGLGNSEQAIAAWSEAMNKSFGKTGARARCMVGEVLFGQKKYNEAINQFKLVVYGSFNDPEAVKPWQAFAAYEAARCYYVQIQGESDTARRTDLIKNAKQFFQILVDQFPNDKLTADAKQQIQVLNGIDN